MNSDLNLLELVTVGLGQHLDLLVHALDHQIDVISLLLQVLHVLIILRLQLLQQQIDVISLLFQVLHVLIILRLQLLRTKKTAEWFIY